MAVRETTKNAKVRLGDVLSVKARIGWQGLTQKEHQATGEYNLVTGTDFREGKVDFNRCVFVGKERYDQDPNIQLRDGDILITKDGTIGKVAVVEGMPRPATLNSGVFVLRDISGTLLVRYLYHYFLAPGFRRIVDGKLIGCTISHLNQKVLVNLPIPVRSLPEQKRIAEELDRICELKKNAEERLALMDQLVKSRFVEMFGSVEEGSAKFKVVHLNDVCTSMSAGKDVPEDYVKVKDSLHQVPIYSNGVENDGLYGYASKPRIFEPSLTISGRGTIGHVCRREVPFVPIIRLIVATPNNDIVDLVFLQWALKGRCAKNTGTTIPQLPVPAAKSIRVILPPLALQREFAAFVAEVDKSKAVLRETVAQMETLYKAKLQEYFG